MKKSLPGDEIYEAWVLLRRVCDAIYVARSKDLRIISISPTEAGCLFIIKLKENMVTPAEIARYLFRRPHSISGLINRMEKKGLVTKNKDLPRKNQIRVALTEKGERVYSQSTNRKSITRILSVLSKEELEQFTSYLKKLRAEALKEIKVDIALSFPE
jgi:DNA-binding MarR family transcriptional regulator